MQTWALRCPEFGIIIKKVNVVRLTNDNTYTNDSAIFTSESGA